MSSTGPPRSSTEYIREEQKKSEAVLEKAGDIGQRIEEKFDYYLVALAFTVLGFSIQTAKPAAWRPADFIEVAAWIAFLFAGVAGLVGLQNLARFFLSQARLVDPRPSREKTKGDIDRAEARVRVARRLRWVLVLGLLLLLVARAAQVLTHAQPTSGV